MLASVPILMLSNYKLFLPDPQDATAGYLLAWLVILWLGWTVLFIPYYAWAAELSPEYNERRLRPVSRRGFDAGLETPVRVRTCDGVSVDGVDCVELPTHGVPASGTQEQAGSRSGEDTSGDHGLITP